MCFACGLCHALENRMQQKMESLSQISKQHTITTLYMLNLLTHDIRLNSNTNMGIHHGFTDRDGKQKNKKVENTVGWEGGVIGYNKCEDVSVNVHPEVTRLKMTNQSSASQGTEGSQRQFMTQKSKDDKQKEPDGGPRTKTRKYFKKPNLSFIIRADCQRQLWFCPS